MLAIVHFEIHASDVDRAKKFYTEVFDWKIERYGDMDYWGIHTGRGKYEDGSSIGMDGGLLPRRGDAPIDGAAVNAYVCTLEVKDIDAVMKQVEACGGKVVVAKNAIAGMLWQCFCKDTEGNIFGLMQTDPKAQ